MNENEIMVSISCLTYCHEKYIRKCLDGFLMQKTNFKFEVLVHDDASPDGTADIIREYAEKYPDIIKPILQTENQYSKGVSIGATYQAPRIKGKYVAMCEGDDYWIDSNKLQKQFDALENNPDCHLCVHQVMRVRENGSEVHEYSDKHIQQGLITQSDFFAIIDNDPYGTPFQTSSYFMRSDSYISLLVNPPKYRQVCVVGDLTMLLNGGMLGPVYYYKDSMSCYRNGVPTSFTKTVPRDRSKLINLYKSRYDTYNEFEDYCAHKYSLSKIKTKSLHKYYLLQENYSCAWNCVKGKPYLCDSKKDYIQVFAKANLPLLYKLQRKIRGKN